MLERPPVKRAVRLNAQGGVWRSIPSAGRDGMKLVKERPMRDIPGICSDQRREHVMTVSRVSSAACCNSSAQHSMKLRRQSLGSAALPEQLRCALPDEARVGFCVCYTPTIKFLRRGRLPPATAGPCACPLEKQASGHRVGLPGFHQARRYAATS